MYNFICVFKVRGNDDNVHFIYLLSKVDLYVSDIISYRFFLGCGILHGIYLAVFLLH